MVQAIQSRLPNLSITTAGPGSSGNAEAPTNIVWPPHKISCTRAPAPARTKAKSYTTPSSFSHHTARKSSDRVQKTLKTTKKTDNDNTKQSSPTPVATENYKNAQVSGIDGKCREQGEQDGCTEYGRHVNNCCSEEYIIYHDTDCKTSRQVLNYAGRSEGL